MKLRPGRHLRRHARFYGAIAAGVAVFLASGRLSAPTRFLIAGDVFFALYGALMFLLAARMTPDTLRSRAEREDEGMPIILGLTAFGVLFVLASVFLIVNQASRPGPFTLALAVVSVPLAWTMVHVLAAFHYADLYYSPSERLAHDDEEEEPDARVGDAGGLQFPETPEPGIGDFFYYSFVIGMTAQVSDVAVSSATLRRATLVHGIFSFFYNTVLIAFTVNAAVTLAN